MNVDDTRRFTSIFPQRGNTLSYQSNLAPIGLDHHAETRQYSRSGGSNEIELYGHFWAFYLEAESKSYLCSESQDTQLGMSQIAMDDQCRVSKAGHDRLMRKPRKKPVIP